MRKWAWLVVAWLVVYSHKEARLKGEPGKDSRGRSVWLEKNDCDVVERQEFIWFGDRKEAQRTLDTFAPEEHAKMFRLEESFVDGNLQ